MGFLSVLSFVQQLVKQRVQPGDHVIDATLGNGIDASFLARTVGANGLLYGFDIQPEAVEATKQRLHQEALSHIPCELFIQSHEHMQQAIPAHDHGSIAAVMFNLGYLPGGSPEVITTPNSTLKALEAASAILRVHGLVTIVLYPGHQGGEEESSAVEQWAAHLPTAQFQVIQYRFTNRQPHAPYCIAIEKSKAGELR